MKHLNLVFIVLGLCLIGCNQKNSKNKLTTEKNLNDITNNRSLRKENSSSKEQLEKYKIDSINNFVALFQEMNMDGISRKIIFPLNREYPIPPIKDQEEFKRRFSEVFDKILIDKIANSKIDQWSEVGWRGITLDNGILWMENSNGTITSVNYQSDFEKKLWNDLIAKEKEILHSSLKTFESPTLEIKTKNYLIRIDQLTNHKYRYASWDITKKESSKPDIIISNGELAFQGSGGNQVFTFVDSNYKYRIYRTILGARNSPEITLEIEKDGHIISTQEGTFHTFKESP